jgi:hypothetical protein
MEEFLEKELLQEENVPVMLQARIFVALCLSVGCAWSQQATVQGEVRDSSNAVVPGATITVKNTKAGTVFTATANESGFYSLPSLVSGTYSVTARATGFAVAENSSLTLDVGEVARVDFTLKPGAISESVNVTAAATALNTDTSVVGQVITNRTTVELPLNGRNYLQLAQLTAGVSPDFGSRTTSQGTFSAVGQSSYQVSVQLDGIDNSSRASGGELGYQAQAVTPSVDAVEEFKVITNNNSAEYGGRMGGTVVVQTKSGTNDFHGSAYEFLRNDKVDATNFFSVGQPKPEYRQNQFGATTGGPIVRNKLFFFSSAEFTRIRQGQSSISTVPIATERAGDFSQEKTIYDPLTTAAAAGGTYTRSPFPGNQIPSSRFDPVATKVIGLYPLPNLPGIGNNYYYSGRLANDTNQYDGRVDYVPTSNDRIFVRYSRREYTNVTPGNLPLPADGGHWQTVDLTSNSVSANWDRVISATANNEFRLGYVRTNSVLDIPWTQNYNASLGIQGIVDLGNSTERGMTLFNPANYAQVGSQNFWPNTNNLGVIQISDTYAKVAGTHVLKFGVTLDREYLFRLASRFDRGNMTFDGSFSQNPLNRGATGDAMADFLMGMATGGNFGNQNGESMLVHNYAAFAQDDWRITPKLTLNLGVRWDRFGAPSFHATAVSNILLNFAQQSYTITTPSDKSDCGCIQNSKNFSPRVGFAYQGPWKTVVRAGFGFFYAGPTVSGQDYARFFNQPPEFSEFTFPTDRLFTPGLIVSNGFPAGLFPTSAIRQNVTIDTAPERYPNQYAMEYFADVEKALTSDTVLTISYIGNGTRQLAYSVNLNTPYLPGPGVLQSRRPYPYFGTIQEYPAGANGSYSALAVKGEKRYSKGLTFIASYTWSHNITEGTGLLNDDSQSLRDPYNIALDRGNAGYDLRHNFVASAVYDLPLGNGRRWLNHNGPVDWVLGGWQAGGIFTARSGQYFTPTINTDLANMGTTNYPNRIANGALTSDQRSIADWFNIAAFALPAQYTFGNSGKNVLEGPGLTNLDFNLSKFFVFGERFRLQFRAEAFNLTNTPAFGLPNAVINSPTAGKISTAGAPREVQFALKFLF